MEQLNNTMTYYETLKKVVDYLNETNGQVTDLTDSLTYLQGEGLDLSVLDNFNSKISDGTISDLINNNLLSNKVDKISGKVLSTNDYSNTDKTEVGKVKDKADTSYVDGKVGVLSNLQTTDKSNLVNAINENKTLLVDKATQTALNTTNTNVSQNTSDLQQRGVNVKLLGAKGDGISNDTAIIQNAINTYDKIFIPNGTYLVTNLTVPSNKVITGQDMYKTVLNSVTSGYVFSTVDKAYMVNINNLSIKSNGVSSGIRVVCSSNTGLTEYDIGVNIENIYMNNFSTGVLLDAFARECRITNVRCYYGGYYGGTAFLINGTDNFIERCTAASINYKGFYLGANNKVNNCKAFMCGIMTGDPGFHVTSYCNLTNICAQQNYGVGIYVEGDSNYIDTVSDSNGFNNSFIDLAYGISVNGRFNQIRGTVVDGRLGGNLKSPLNITNNAILNSIDITYKVLEGKSVYDNDSFSLVSFLKNSLNNITINASPVMRVSDIIFNELKSMSYTSKFDATGTVTLTNNEFQINMTNYQAIASGWGSTVRFDVVPLNTTSKKYMVVKGQIKVTGDTYGYALTMMSGTAGTVNGTARVIICPQYISRQYSDFYAVYDLTLLASQVPDAKLWLGLFKNTASSVGTNISAYFKDVKVYFTD